MQIESKYYIPQISEFCVGFIYEAFIPERNCWSVEIFHLNDSHITLIRQNKHRVKYLDKEDIESLGFVFDPNASENGIMNFEKGTKNKNIGITVVCDQDVVIYKWAEGKEHILFDGVIKNKSELRRLMQQLSIA